MSVESCKGLFRSLLLFAGVGAGAVVVVVVVMIVVVADGSESGRDSVSDFWPGLRRRLRDLGISCVVQDESNNVCVCVCVR